MSIIARIFRRQRVEKAVDKRPAKAIAYDAGKASRHTDRWWAGNADSESANKTLTRELREKLRNRARYEVANNSVANGIVQTIVNDVIGTGPRVQFTAADRAERQGLRMLELGWDRWSRRINLVDDLRTIYGARVVDGEGLGIMRSGPDGRRLQLLEVDRLTNLRHDSRNVDGVILDESGRPVQYTIRRTHPGSGIDTTGEYDTYPADQVIHFFRPDRAEQARGVPYLAPALPLFAQLRAYTLATLSSAQAAASFSGVIQSDQTPFDDDLEVPEAGDVFDLERGAFVTMPMGWKLAQLKAEQPTTAYESFRRAIINEIARCLNMPYNVAAADSSDYNYASGRLDHQVYDRQITTERDAVERRVLDRLLRMYLEDVASRAGNMPSDVRDLVLSQDVALGWQWHWPAREHVDPAKEATAAATRLAAGVSNLKIEYARQGRDWEEELEQRAREVAFEVENGLGETAMVPPMEDDDDVED